MLPPSRGKRNEGAVAPSARTDRAAADAPNFPGEEFEALVFDAVAVPDFAMLTDFNALDAGLCDPLETDVPACLLVVLLLDLVATGSRDFEDGFFAVVREGARLVFSVGDLGDFLRVFLDIRLPFVAFRGTINEVLRQAGIRSTCWASQIGSEYA